MIKKLFAKKTQAYTEIQIVTGLQEHDRKVEEWYYRSARRYFDNCFNQEFFDKDKKQDIFQTAFLKLWMEIDNHRIHVRDGRICRKQSNGEVQPMSCKLNTFLMAFAKTEYRELARNSREDFFADLFEHTSQSHLQTTMYDRVEDLEYQKNQIVDDCISQLPPRCAEILTLFYYKEMSLDEILEARSDKNQSKNGLKTAKNKCMNTLRERVMIEFQKYHLTA